MIQFAYHKKARRGISTVLGMLLMVVIIFTTIIPLFIYANSVDNHYDTTVVNMGIADQERSMEDLTVYAYGRDNSYDINVILVNEGSIAINITRIWVMSMDLQRINIFTSENVSVALNAYDLPLQLNPSNQMEIENLTLTIIEEDPEKDQFNIETTSARGNIFASSTNYLSYNGGNWGTGMRWPWLEIIIRSDEGQDDFQVDVVSNSNSFTDTITSEHVLGDYLTIIPVLKTGSYNVTATNITQKMNPIELGTQTLIVWELQPISMAIFIDPD
ncbi:MAG: hypothetical protein V3R57_03705 [Candidatus Bathyarchaeia archaeon]